MLKKPNIECPLRKLREITGKSQAAFAKGLGCSVSVIKKIEGGDNSKLHEQLILSASLVFGVSANSLIPPSTQPVRVDGEIYTKEFCDGWWKTAPEKVKPAIQHFKALMVRELEMVLAAAIRVPGMGVGAVLASFNTWAMETIIDLELEPHYEAEWNERINRAKKKSNQIQADWELVKLFIGNKAQFIQEAFEADLSPTPFMAGHLAEKSGLIKQDLDWKKKSKFEKLKSMADFGTTVSKKAFQAVVANNAGPKLKR
jgi:transcriptional regulator with XRE-family HTH domain